MREIRFRGFDAENKVWRYGWYTRLVERARKFDAIVYDEDGTLIRYYIHDPETVGQFTGRKTNKGQELWEGDIISLTKEDNWLRTYVIQWSDITSSFICKCIKNGPFVTELGELFDYEIDVIGNIHDTPELMTASQEATNGK